MTFNAEDIRAAKELVRAAREASRASMDEARAANRELVAIKRKKREHREQFERGLARHRAVAPDHPAVAEFEAALAEMDTRDRARAASKELPTPPRTKVARPLRARSDGSVVYFVQSVHGGPIKIGTTRNIEHRLRALQAGSSSELMILATAAGDQRLEIDLHRRLKAHRLHGEWFADCEAVRAAMNEALL